MCCLSSTARPSWIWPSHANKCAGRGLPSAHAYAPESMRVCICWFAPRARPGRNPYTKMHISCSGFKVIKFWLGCHRLLTVALRHNDVPRRSASA
jgi:hypothetical protein